MKWQRGHRSDDVEDRRGRSAGGAAKLGGGAAALALVVALLSQAVGVDLGGLLGSGGGATSSEAPSGGGPPDPASDPDRELVEFIHFVFDDIQGAFARSFAAEGKPYRPARLVLFTDEVRTGCGLSSSAIGPFYCPPDDKAYIDLSFYRVLRERLGAGGDFAQAYVLAHELGHHLQNVLGVDDDVRRRGAGRSEAEQNALSVRQELQADCFAGVWAHSTGKRDLLERGDIEESVTAAAAIGDDRLQTMGGGKVNPETWTHGSSAQRVAWFRTGLERGTLAACDTFAAERP